MLVTHVKSLNLYRYAHTFKLCACAPIMGLRNFRNIFYYFIGNIYCFKYLLELKNSTIIHILTIANNIMNVHL